MASAASPRVVVNPYAAAAGAATPASAPNSPYAMAAMVMELQRSQAALARLRAENRKYKVREELESAPLSGGMLAWTEARAVSTMQASNTCNGACLIASAIGSFFIPGDTVVLSFARLVLVAYMIFMGGIMIAMELRINSLQALVREKLGFLFTYNGRSCFIAFAGTVVMATANLSVAGGGGNVTLWVLAVLTLVNALFNFCVVLRHPAFTHNPERFIAPLAANDTRAFEDRMARYLLAHPDVVLRVARAGAAGAHLSPAAAARIVEGPQRRKSMSNPSTATGNPWATAAAAASAAGAGVGGAAAGRAGAPTVQQQQVQQQQMQQQQQQRGRQAAAGAVGTTPRAKSEGPPPGNPFASASSLAASGGGGGGAAAAQPSTGPTRERRKSFAAGKIVPDASNSWLWGGSAAAAAAASNATASAAAAPRPAAVADWRGAGASPSATPVATPTAAGSFRDTGRKKSFVNPFDSPRYKGGL